MKKSMIHLLLIGNLVLLAHVTFSQKIRYEKVKFAPVRGHYKILQELSILPTASRTAWDRLSFPFDSANYQKRLSLTPIYLTGITPEMIKMPEMPANSSEQTRAELDYLLQLQAQRVEEDERKSLFFADVYYNLRVKPTDTNYPKMQRNLFHIGRSIGTWFNADSLPKTAKLIKNVWQDASYFIWYFKFKYSRIRPYKLETKLKNVQETDWAAYPSGHSANSYVNAFIFQVFAPEFSDIFIKDAYDMAHSREIIGVHYPSDSEASRVMARQIVDYLFQNEQFIRDFEDAKKEWIKYGTN
jgi:acid phosphatase (class A)